MPGRLKHTHTHLYTHIHIPTHTYKGWCHTHTLASPRTALPPPSPSPASPPPPTPPPPAPRSPRSCPPDQPLDFSDSCGGSFVAACPSCTRWRGCKRRGAGRWAAGNSSQRGTVSCGTWGSASGCGRLRGTTEHSPCTWRHADTAGLWEEGERVSDIAG